ncbi:MAG: hypothetical protein IPJ07_16980 [Acidobacteria bacterium]|nr:hypothetical protein [Acidobacteriota bacterium]
MRRRTMNSSTVKRRNSWPARQLDSRLSACFQAYSRSKGVSPDSNSKGTVISQDTEHMEGVYHKGVTAREVLKENKVKAPAVVQVFPRTLSTFSPRKARW